MKSTRHATKDKGDLALSQVISNLRQHDILTCLPLSEHLPFDLIAVMPDMATLLRVQAKYRSGTQYGTVLVEFKNNYYDSKKIYSKPVNFNEIDAYAVYIPDIDRVCYFRVENLPSNASSLTLRFEPPKNNQRKGVHLVKDFLNPLSIAENTTKKVNLVSRQVSLEDEIAISKFAAYLQCQNMYPVYPRSIYTPFDLLSITSDTQHILRYRIGFDRVHYTPYADVFVMYTDDSEYPIFLEAGNVNPKMGILDESDFMA